MIIIITCFVVMDDFVYSNYCDNLFEWVYKYLYFGFGVIQIQPQTPISGALHDHLLQIMEECIQSSAEIPDQALSDQLKDYFSAKVKQHVGMVYYTNFLHKVAIQTTKRTVDCLFTILFVLGPCPIMNNSLSVWRLGRDKPDSPSSQIVLLCIQAHMADMNHA